MFSQKSLKCILLLFFTWPISDEFIYLALMTIPINLELFFPCQTIKIILIL